MDINFEIAGGIVYIRQSGDYDADVYLDAVARIVAAPDFVVGMPVIADARRLTRTLTIEHLRRIRDGLDDGELRNFRPARYAMVSTVPFFDKLAKLAETLVADRIDNPPPGFDIQRFATVEDAEEWLRRTVPGVKAMLAAAKRPSAKP